MTGIDKADYAWVCKNCETPKKASNWQPLRLVARVAWAALATVMLFTSFFVFGMAALALIIIFEVSRAVRKARCKACGKNALVPATTPVGIEIMKKNGWVPLSK